MIIRMHNGCEYWYDRSVRSWFAAKIDSEGNLGPSIDAYTKREIIDAIDRGFCI